MASAAEEEEAELGNQNYGFQSRHNLKKEAIDEPKMQVEPPLPPRPGGSLLPPPCSAGVVMTSLLVQPLEEKRKPGGLLFHWIVFFRPGWPFVGEEGWVIRRLRSWCYRYSFEGFLGNYGSWTGVVLEDEDLNSTITRIRESGGVMFVAKRDFEKTKMHFYMFHSSMHLCYN